MEVGRGALLLSKLGGLTGFVDSERVTALVATTGRRAAAPTTAPTTEAAALTGRGLKAAKRTRRPG